MEEVFEKEEKNEVTKRIKKPSRLRRTIPQICAMIPENFTLLAIGLFVGFITIVIAGLTNNTMNISADKTDISWIGTVFEISAPIGCLIGAPLSIFLGRKRIMQLSMIPYTLIWLIFYYSTTLKSLYFAFLLAGLITGIVLSATSNYTAEVTQPHVRGILLSFSSTSVFIGLCIQFLMGLFTDWRTASLISLIFPVLGFLAISFVPESPYWLAEKGRVKDAEKALCWLRGWVSPSQVQDELTMIRSMSQSQNDDHEDNETMKTKFWVEFTRRQFILPFILTMICVFVGSFGGSIAVQFHCKKLFQEIGSLNISADLARMYLGLAELVGTIVSVVSIYFTGKRIINFTSIGGTGLCYFGVSVYIYLMELNVIDRNSYSWIPTTLLIGGGFFSHLGIKCLPFILLGEIFPIKMKSIATGTLVALKFIFQAAAGGSFLIISGVTGLSGTFLLYAAVNAVGLIAIYVMLFETEGKTLQEIAEHYAGIRSLKEKPHKRDSKVSL